MKRLFLAVLAVLATPVCTAAPATAPTIAGCGTVITPKADRTNKAKLSAQLACFETAGASATGAATERRALLAAIVAPAPVPTPSPTPTPAPVIWQDCAGEAGVCRIEGTAQVRYGAGERWSVRTATGSIGCNNGAFGDPAPGSVKRCQTTGTLTPSQPSPVPAPTPVATAPELTPAPPKGVLIPREKLGVNVATPNYYGKEPLFANLLTGSGWLSSNWSEAPAGTMDAAGAIRVKDGERFYRLLTAPTSVLSGTETTVVCTWDGSGSASIQGARGAASAGAHGARFVWPGARGGAGNVWLEVSSSAAADPLRNLDCREKNLPRSAVFSPDAVDQLRPFGVLRFMDWSGVNGNPTDVTWAKRTQPDSIEQTASGYGVALEHMVGLAKLLDADGWYNVPWNADDDYVRRMAQLVHDGTPANRHVYVEVSNEVWNWQFGVTKQASAEGMAAGLSDNQYEANLLRLAEKTRAVMAIWSQVFADRPGQLVRIISTQAWSPNTAELVLGRGKAATFVDALAIAPYFGLDLFEKHPGVTDLGVLMPTVAASEEEVMAGPVTKTVAIARKYGVRLISYEAGQHVMNHTNADVLKAINRSPAMGEIYRRYLAAWNAKVGDLNVLFNSTGPITTWGAWGLREYSGQPRTEAPKMDAALTAMGQ